MIVPVAGALPMGAAIATGTGLHAATWGAFKDSPYEGFHLLRLLRTPVVAVLAASVALLTGLVHPGQLLPTVGVVYTLERLATEGWKTILRSHDSGAFTIPMRLGFRGRPVDVAWRRYSVGLLVLAGMFGTGWLLHWLQDHVPTLPWWVTVATIGGMGGWLTALGGAWKDAPIEGFSGWKFLRSPAVATAWAVPLSATTSDWVTLCLASGGFAVATIETYKTFMTGDRAPGKFAARMRPHRVQAVRAVVGKLHAATWLLLSVTAIAQAATSRSATSRGPVGHSVLALTDLGIALVGVFAARVASRATDVLTTPDASLVREVAAELVEAGPASTRDTHRSSRG